MYKLSLSFALLFFTCSYKHYSDLYTVIQNQDYSFEITREFEQRFPNRPDSTFGKEDLTGVVVRRGKDYFLNCQRLIGIQHDTVFISIDTLLRMVLIAKKEDMRQSLLPFSLDPFDILEYANSNKATSNEIVTARHSIKKFFFSKENLFKEVTLQTWSSADSSNILLVNMIYTQLNHEVNERLIFKLNTNKEKINFNETDFIINDAGTYKLSPQLKMKNYTVTDLLSL